MTKVMLVDFSDMLKEHYPIVNDLPKPGYVVGSRFGALVHRWCGRGEPARLGIDVPSLGEVRRLVSEDALACGLLVQPEQKHGHKLIVEAPGDPAGLRQIDRHSVYALSDARSIMMAMSALIQHIAKFHGPGRIWFVGAPGYLNRSEEPAGQVSTRLEGTDNSTRDEPYAFTPTGDGTRRVVLGAYYFHDPVTTGEHPYPWVMPVASFIVPRDKMPEAFARGAAEIDAALNKRDRAMTPVGEMGGTIRIKVKVDPTMQPGEMRIEQIADPLDVTYDGVTLRRLLEMDSDRRTERVVGVIISPAQRAAISVHWSAELRAKVAATEAAGRNQVTIDTEDY